MRTLLPAINMRFIAVSSSQLYNLCCPRVCPLVGRPGGGCQTRSYLTTVKGGGLCLPFEAIVCFTVLVGSTTEERY